MKKNPVPESIQRFLASDRIVVAGVSRDTHQPANCIYRKLRDTRHEVMAVNPAAHYVEGDHCFPSLDAVPGRVDAVVIATPPAAAPELVEQCARLGISRVWMHRSFGPGSVSDRAVALCREHGISVIVGACPMMYVEPVDLAHRCFRWLMGGPARVS